MCFSRLLCEISN